MNKELVVESNIGHGGWDDILEDIMERLNLADCIRASNVCKSWRSVALHRKNKIKTAQLPWLVLSHDDQPPRLRSLRFFDLLLGSFYNVNFPRTLLECRCVGSSKGWLVIVKGWYINPKLILFNPVSGVELPLPPVDGFSSIVKIEVSCADAPNATLVAAILKNQNTFAICRPKDKSWSIFEDIDDHQRHSCHDILFYKGTLHALIDYEDEVDVNGAFAPTHSMRVGADDDEEVVVKLIPLNVSLRISSWTLNPPANLLPIDESEEFWILKDAALRSFLVESNGELLILLQILDVVEGTIDLMARSIMKLRITVVMLMVMVSMTAVIIPKEMKLAAEWVLMITMMLVACLTTSMMYYMYEKYGDIDDHIDNVPDNEDDEDNDEDDEDNNDINDHNDEDDDDDENHDNGNHNHDEDDDYGDEDFRYCQTSKFEVFKIDGLSGHNMSVTRLNNLGDRTLFVSLSGSMSVQVSKFNELKSNCIFFAEERQEDIYQSVFRNSGIFHLKDEKIERCFPNMNHMSWFSPNL